MERPPQMVPGAFGVIGLGVANKFRNFPPENIGYSAAIPAHRIGVSDTLGAIGIADANGDQLEGFHFAMGAVGQRDGERNPVKSRFDVLDEGHANSPLRFVFTATGLSLSVQILRCVQRRKTALEVGLEVVDVLKPDVESQGGATWGPFCGGAIAIAVEG